MIALSPRAQVEQARGNALLDPLQRNQGDGWDRLLGTLCGADGICLGGNKLSQSYQEGFRASAAVGKISDAVLIATGIAGALRDVALPGLRVALERLGVGAADARQAASAAGELEGVDAAGTGKPLPRITGGAQSSLDPILAADDRTLARYLESWQGAAARAGRATRSADETAIVLQDAVRRGWYAPRGVETEWIGGRHINLVGPIPTTT